MKFNIEILEDKEPQEIVNEAKIVVASTLHQLKQGLVDQTLSESYKCADAKIVGDKFKEYESINEYTYSELKSLKDYKKLIPGKFYILTDYQCYYKQPTSEIDMISEYDGWLLQLQAINNNDFSHDVIIKYTEDSTYKSIQGENILECKYNFDNDTSKYTWAIPEGKGVIYYLKDKYFNEMPYDFKHIKFRRWAITDIKPNKRANTRDVYRAYTDFTNSDKTDKRSWVGSGDDKDKEVIDAVYNGTLRQFWGLSNPILSELSLKQNVHCWQLESNEKYLSFTPDLDEYYSTRTNTGGLPSCYGLSEFTTDSEDYKDFYTFDLNGVDATGLKKGSTNRVRNTRMNTINSYSKGQMQLPNTVFIFNYDYDSYINNVHFDQAINNTIVLIHRGPKGAYTNCVATIDTIKANIFTGNVLYINLLKNATFIHFTYNYVNGSFDKGTYSAMKSTFFGRYNNVYFDECNQNLLIGLDRWYQPADAEDLESTSSWKSTDDGTYWYDVTAQGGWFGYNIMGPMQYVLIRNHVNTNTIWGYYNKGIDFGCTCQYNTIKSMKHGTVIGYGLEGQKFGDLWRSTIASHAFANISNEDAISMKSINDSYPTIDVIRTDIKTASLRWPDIVNNLTDEQKNLLKDTTKAKLLTASSVDNVKVIDYSTI